MKLLSLTLVFVTVYFVGIAQESTTYKGKIGPYSVTLHIDSCGYSTGQLYGKYAYGNRKTFITLKGEYTSPIFFAEEFLKDQKTGEWYIEKIDDSLIGYWVGNNKQLPVSLAYFSGNKEILKRETERERNQKTNAKIAGRYEINYNFINEMWLSEEMLTPEIGYNGGHAIITDLGTDSIYFSVEIICGPTYHFAFAEGVAHKTTEGFTYVYKNEDECEITLQFQNKKLLLKSNNTMACGFGARAYLDHELYKVQD